MSNYLGRADIDKAEDLPRLAIHIPEWNGTVLVARLDAGARLEYQTWMQTTDATRFDHVWRLVALTLVDAEGARLYADDEAHLLKTKAPNAITRVFWAAMEHNRLGDTEVSKAQGESEPDRSSATA